MKRKILYSTLAAMMFFPLLSFAHSLQEEQSEAQKISYDLTHISNWHIDAAFPGCTEASKNDPCHKIRFSFLPNSNLIVTDLSRGIPYRQTWHYTWLLKNVTDPNFPHGSYLYLDGKRTWRIFSTPQKIGLIATNPIKFPWGHYIEIFLIPEATKSEHP